MHSRQRGFTLVEILISVALLSVVCALVLRLFLLAGEVNFKTAQKQHAILAAADILENFRNIEDIYSIENDSFFSAGTVSKGEDSIIIGFFYDQDWNLSVHGVNSAQVFIYPDDENVTEAGVIYIIKAMVSGEEGELAQITGGRYFAKQ